MLFYRCNISVYCINQFGYFKFLLKFLNKINTHCNTILMQLNSSSDNDICRLKMFVYYSLYDCYINHSIELCTSFHAHLIYMRLS